MTPDQMKAARKLLRWSVHRLSVCSETSYHMVNMYEQTGRVGTVRRRPDLTDAVAAIRATLEAAGVEFISENGGSNGVRLRNSIGAE